MLTSQFQEALTCAASVHAGDPRKGTSIPYIAHLLSVCSLILTDGGSEDEAIAGLLHDTLEDHPDKVTPAALERQFGSRVRTLVDVNMPQIEGFFRALGFTPAPLKALALELPAAPAPAPC